MSYVHFIGACELGISLVLNSPAQKAETFQAAADLSWSMSEATHSVFE